MSLSTRSEFVDLVVPLEDRLKLYNRTKRSTDQPLNDATDPAKAIPQGFIDAMSVREEVFVDEQKIPLENELDEDDARSFHWVAYASIPAKRRPESQSESTRRTSDSTKLPIGTIRLVPPPHTSHDAAMLHRRLEAIHRANPTAFSPYTPNEPYIKLGRLAVIPEFRKAGISRLLIETAIAFARDHSESILPVYEPTQYEAMKKQHRRDGYDMLWSGLVLLHVQTGVQKVWRKYGFETDERVGTWDEEGIEHVAMWRRLDVLSERRRKSKAALPLAT